MDSISGSQGAAPAAALVALEGNAEAPSLDPTSGALASTQASRARLATAVVTREPPRGADGRSEQPDTLTVVRGWAGRRGGVGAWR